ncbi:glycosyltransferase family 39 protein [Hydrogenimonas sp. SS33]|uniref:ArnT family glycosyltransferase n=1 Tax=Hydrogenimonas leucolamina TaxID=2954236 RepID=UPI00336BBE07
MFGIDRKIFFLFLLFTTLLIALVWTREAWIDESWFAAYAVNFIRHGTIADLNMARFTDNLPHSFFFYAYALLQAPFYALFGEHLSVGRLITVFFALTGLYGIYLNFVFYLDLKRKEAMYWVWPVAFTYYYVIAATQIRPDLISVTLVLFALAAFHMWQKEQRYRWLFLTHTLFVYALLLHLQTAYALLAFWVYFVIYHYRKRDRGRILFYSLLPYLLVLLFFVTNTHFKENLHIFYDTLLGEHNRVENRSMLHSILVKIEEGQYLRAGVRAGILVLILCNFLRFVRLRGFKTALSNPFFVTAAGSFASWILAVNSIGSYHAVWLVPSFMVMSAVTARSGVRLLRLFNLLFFAILVAASLKFAFTNITENPLRQQRQEIKYLDTKYGLSHSTLFVQRDLMWFYRFGPNVTYRLHSSRRMPEFLVFRKSTHKKKRVYLSGDEPGIRLDGKDVPYRYIDETKHLLLYRRCTDDCR